MNLTSNPWSFVPADVQTQTIATITLNPDGTVTLVGTGALPASMIQDTWVTVINVTNPIYNMGYKIIAVINATTLLLAPMDNDVLQPYLNRIPVGTAPSAGGVVGFNQYNSMVRIEDISWQSTGAPLAGSVIGGGDVLVITDFEGNVIWSAVAPATPSSYSQNRGKIFWVTGITLFAMTHGIVLMTIN
jgi:hypothetical protein